ncbi:MAG: hypothetical protein CMJ18_25235 [Phycisphaeraceae bacterium]|nr:hypothetical protein [Phycisphaeraceae bacterium]
MKRIDHLIFLVHPCCYEGLDAEAIRANNSRHYVEVERGVKQRWIEALAARPPATLFVQLYGPQPLFDVAVEHLGADRSVYLRAPFPEDEDMREYYRRLMAVLHEHVETHGLELDPETVTSELWGESFEGCVNGYGGAFAEHLELNQPPRMRFEMTVPDARFVHGSIRHEPIPIPGTDVEAWLFECHDRTSAATFQPRRTAAWLDERRVKVMLDDRRIQVCTKLGHTIWPETPWHKNKPEQTLEYAEKLSEFNDRYVRSIGIPYDDFRKTIAAAVVEGTGTTDGHG